VRLTRPPALAVALVVVLSAAATVAGCSSSEPSPTAAPTTSSASPTPPPPATTLLSGRAGSDGQVLAVKIDNTVNAHPQAGVMAADLVYLEEVEWGLTRLLTVYSSKYPKEVGPVRSARITDLDLLQQFGEVAFAFSGANPRLVPLINAAPLHNVSGEVSGQGYWRQSGRTAPWDFFADPKVLLSRATKADKPNDVGFVFSDQKPRGGRTVRSVTVAWPSSTARFVWSKKQQRWLVWSDGSRDMAAEGPQLGGTTVIVQMADVYPSQFGDAYGGVTPMTETVGKGKALVLRDGRAYNVTWQRRSADDGTTWTYRGSDFPMAPGQVWIALLDNDRHPTID
jgi:Protein of unknown function (DUF3048) N-terminal domain/Protein of unknown function (DUF3048) C-terminal domain